MRCAATAALGALNCVRYTSYEAVRRHWVFRTWLPQVLICSLTAATLCYLWLEEHHQLQQVRLQLLPLQQRLEEAEQQRAQLQTQVDAFEQPQNLAAKLQEPRFSHLTFPKLHEVTFLTPSD